MRFIHLLYVPTMACSMRCSYCYLGDQTDRSCTDGHGVLETLEHAIRKLHAAEVVPFNISLHGGEVTTLPAQEFRQLAAFIHSYYEQNHLLLKSYGSVPGTPHIKTNLFTLDRHIDAIRDYQITVSGSIDLPLFMHRQHRRTKDGADTLDRILRNTELLRDIPCRKKVSATIFREHFEHMEQIAQDIRWLHGNTCLDMNDFNFMFGFASPDAPNALTPLTQQQQVQFYEYMQKEFTGTGLEKGLTGPWFAEFGPEYCTNCTNCGEKFFLLERNGDLYSCVRGQGHPDFFYGNIYTDSVEQILACAADKIRKAHACVPFEEQCGSCRWLDLCKTGCPFVKKNDQSGLSYTCLLQQKLYERDWSGWTPPEDAAYHYLSRMRPEMADAYYSKSTHGPLGMPSLHTLIQQDSRLQLVYDPQAFVLQCDGRDYPLESQLTKQKRDILFVLPQTRLKLYVRRDVLSALSDWPMHNALYMMLLDGRCIVYGDDARSKQAHVATIQIHGYALEQMPSDRPGYYCVQLDELIRPYLPMLGTSAPNNLFFTTSALRDYHYLKQKENAYYHLQAINLPFQNIEFKRVAIPGWPTERSERNGSDISAGPATV